MIVLTRKEGQGAIIGGHTAVFVNKIAGRQVKLAFDTPLGTTVLRSECVENDTREPLGFPVFYRARRKVDGSLAGYALSLPVEESTRFYFEPVEDYDDITDEDNYLELHVYSSEGEAYAMKRGIDLAADDRFSYLIEGRKGRWLVLVDYGADDWHDIAEPMKIFDYTVLRYGKTTATA